MVSIEVIPLVLTTTEYVHYRLLWMYVESRPDCDYSNTSSYVNSLFDALPHIKQHDAYVDGAGFHAFRTSF